MKILLMLLAGSASVLGMAGVGLYLFQDKLIYFPRPYAPGDLESFEARGGLRLGFNAPHGPQVAFFVPCAGEPRQIWCCFAGNGGRALAWEGFARAHAAEGRAFLLVEWPGYGASQGSPRPATLRDSVAGALGALADQLGTTPESLRSRCGVIGHSLGAAGALIAAAELRAHRAILFAPFTSLRDMAVLRKGPLIARLLSHDYDNRAGLAAVVKNDPGTRITIFHGTEDEVVPVWMGRELQARHPDAVRLIELPGMGHNGLFAPAASHLAAELAMEP